MLALILSLVIAAVPDAQFDSALREVAASNGCEVSEVYKPTEDDYRIATLSCREARISLLFVKGADGWSALNRIFVAAPLKRGEDI